MGFVEMIVMAFGIGLSIIIIAFFAALGYMLIEAARQTVNKK